MGEKIVRSLEKAFWSAGTDALEETLLHVGEASPGFLGKFRFNTRQGEGLQESASEKKEVSCNPRIISAELGQGLRHWKTGQERNLDSR